MTGTEDQSDDGKAHTRRKVGRVIEDYGLDDWGERLEARWTGDGEERRSLRTLATEFNRAVLRSAMADAGLNPLDGQAANTYRLLTDDDVTGGSRRQAERKLERAGIDVDGLRSDFVSHQAVHTYLTEFRGVDHAGSERDSVEQATARIQRLTSRCRAVAENTIDSLASGGRVSVGEHTVTVDVQVICRDCNAQFGAVELIRRGGCRCEDD